MGTVGGKGCGGLARAGSSWELGWLGRVLGLLVVIWEYGPWGPKGLALNPGSVVYSQGDLPDFSDSSSVKWE